MTKSAIRNPQSAIVRFLLAALGLAAYFVGLNMPFVGPDEPRYAQVAREMYERGDWITPTLGGFPWFEKPPLLYWLEIVSYNIFGVGEFAARVGPALCGLGTIASLWILGKAIPHQRPKTDLANYLALIAASTLSVIVFSHGASFDIVVTFTMTAALVSFFIFDRAESPGSVSAPLILFYVFIGLSLLAKGLIGIVFPFAIVGFYYALSRRMPTRAFIISLFWGIVLAAAIASVWYVPMYLRHGGAFFDEFVIQHHFARFTSNKYKHPQPFYFFLWVMPLMLLPWTPFFVVSIWKSVREFLRRKLNREHAGKPLAPFGLSQLLLFAVCWLIVPMVFFSFSGSKLPGYILPAVPAGIIIAAIYVLRLATRTRQWSYAAIGLSAMEFLTVITASLTAVPGFADSESTKALITAAGERGYVSERVYGLHAISHNAEFYAAGRLLREPLGEQKRFYGPAEVATDMERTGLTQALVFVPLEYTPQLQAAPMLRAEFIRDNGELAIYAVSLP